MSDSVLKPKGLTLFIDIRFNQKLDIYSKIDVGIDVKSLTVVSNGKQFTFNFGYTDNRFRNDIAACESVNHPFQPGLDEVTLDILNAVDEITHIDLDIYNKTTDEVCRVELLKPVELLSVYFRLERSDSGVKIPNSVVSRFKFNNAKTFEPRTINLRNIFTNPDKVFPENSVFLSTKNIDSIQYVDGLVIIKETSHFTPNEVMALAVIQCAFWDTIEFKRVIYSCTFDTIMDLPKCCDTLGVIFLNRFLEPDVNNLTSSDGIDEQPLNNIWNAIGPLIVSEEQCEVFKRLIIDKLVYNLEPNGECDPLSTLIGIRSYIEDFAANCDVEKILEHKFEDAVRVAKELLYPLINLMKKEFIKQEIIGEALGK